MLLDLDPGTLSVLIHRVPHSTDYYHGTGEIMRRLANDWIAAHGSDGVLDEDAAVRMCGFFIGLGRLLERHRMPVSDFRCDDASHVTDVRRNVCR